MMSELKGIYAVWYREFLVFFREKERLISTTITPILWLLVLGFGLGTSVELEEGTEYSEFLFPGIIAMNVLFVSLFYGMYIVWDRKLDFLKEVLVAPIRRSSVFLGKLLGGVTDVAIQSAILFFIGMALFGFDISLISLILGYFITLYIAICIVSIGLTIGSNLSRPEGFNLVVSFVMWPMFLLSGALFPTDKVPSWLQPFVLADPLFYGVDALRQVMVGTQGMFHILIDLFALGCIALVSMGFAILSFRKLEV